jgi:hypothetical protein
MKNVTSLRALDFLADGSGHTCSASAATEVTVRCPSQPPPLLPGAAGVLLCILRAVAESDTRSATGREWAA